MKQRLIYAALLLSVAAVGEITQPFRHIAAIAQPGCQIFEQTGQVVCGKFLTYWNTHGGLAQQGYPIGPEITEVSELNGQAYTVQYFERAVFELHPENKPPNDVLLSQLGTYQARRRYGNPPVWQAVPAPVPQQLKAGVSIALVGKGSQLRGWTTGLDPCLGGAMAWVLQVENASNAPYTVSLDKGFYMTDGSGREYRDLKGAQCGGPLGGDIPKGPVTLQATQSSEFGVYMDATGLPTSATHLELHLSVAGVPLTFRYSLR
jgi:hypothetical protein